LAKVGAVAAKTLKVAIITVSVLTVIILSLLPVVVMEHLTKTIKNFRRWILPSSTLKNMKDWRFQK